MKKSGFKAHISGICAMFAVGEIGILIPYKGSDEKTFSGFLIAAVIMLFVLSVWNYSVKKYIYGTHNGFKKFAVVVIFLFIIAFAVYTAAGTFVVFNDFVSGYILPETPKIITALLFAAITVYLLLNHKEVFFKLSLTAFVFSAVLISVMFIFSAADFEAENIILLSFPNGGDLIGQALPYMTKAFAPMLLTAFYCMEADEKNDMSAILRGAAIGMVMLAVILLNDLLILGGENSGKTDYPYSESIATVTVGKVFTRTDGFSYFVFFFSCLIKIYVCIYVICALGKRVIGFYRKKDKV